MHINSYGIYGLQHQEVVVTEREGEISHKVVTSFMQTKLTLDFAKDSHLS